MTFAFILRASEVSQNLAAKAIAAAPAAQASHADLGQGDVPWKLKAQNMTILPK
jgi:hypothetical protein